MRCVFACSLTRIAQSHPTTQKFTHLHHTLLTTVQKEATAEAYIARAREAGVAGALVVQPANHMYDHRHLYLNPKP